MTDTPRADVATPASVVIVNWNTRRRLLDQLAALRAEAPNGLPIIVVDNASTDGGVDAVRARAPAATVIVNRENLGYAAAVNQGVAVAATPYVLIANADVECQPATVAGLAQFLDDHPTAAVIGPRVLNPDGTLQLSWGRDPHLATEFLQRWWWRRLERQPGQPLLRRVAATARRVDWVLGACFMVRRDAFETVGRMDEQYFMYFEEVDLMTRLRRKGWDIWYLPSATVVHHGRASTSQVSDAMAIRYRRSQLRYYQMHHGPWAAWGLRRYLDLRFGWTAEGRQLLQAL